MTARPRFASPRLHAAVLVAATTLAGSACSTSEPREPGSGDPGRYAEAPPFTIDVEKRWNATIATSRGEITLALDPKAAPKTVNNFVFLARDRYYDGLTFHRVEPGFVVQGGDPSGDGSGGPGYTIADETNALLHVEGALAMAKTAAPDSAGSQFYITLAPQPSLDGRYTVFGKVVAGMDVVKGVAKGDVIQRVTITEQ